MTRTPPFLAALGLVDDGQPLDERTLRRAYAVRLKQIDIDTEPQRFQDLRDAFEAALRWSARRERARQADADADADAEPEAEAGTNADDEPAAGATAPSSEAEDPAVEPWQPPAAPAAPPQEAIGAEAFERFRRQVATVFGTEDAAHQALQHALRDERLASIDARAFFEWCIARLLADGWQPGHQHLLDPAIEVFGWNSDHARLANFGQVGVRLAAAIHDRAVGHGFTPAQKASIGPLLDRLRAAEPPQAESLADDVAALQFLVQRVPNWLRIVAPVDPVNERFKLWSERPPAAPAPAPAPAPARAPIGKQPRFMNAKTGPGILAAVISAIVLMLGHASHLTSGPDAAPSAQGSPLQYTSEQDLQQRQQQAEALLATIHHPGAAPARATPASATLPADPYTDLSRPINFDQPAWAPEWAKNPDAHGGAAPPPR